MDVVVYFWLPLEITLLLIHSDLRYSQAGGSRSTFSPNADAWGDVVESGAQSNRGKAESHGKSCELHVGYREIWSLICGMI
jgi:hypothetical protein